MTMISIFKLTTVTAIFGHKFATYMPKYGERYLALKIHPSRSCQEVLNSNLKLKSGVYTLYSEGAVFDAWCEMIVDKEKDQVSVKSCPRSPYLGIKLKSLPKYGQSPDLFLLFSMMDGL